MYANKNILALYEFISWQAILDNTFGLRGSLSTVLNNNLDSPSVELPGITAGRGKTYMSAISQQGNHTERIVTSGCGMKTGHTFCKVCGSYSGVYQS